MSFRAFVKESEVLVRGSLATLNYPIPDSMEWDEPPNKSYGELSFRAGFQLSKQLKKRPPEIASQIASVINESLLKNARYVSRVEAHSSGFLNFFFDQSKLFSDVLRDASFESYGKIDLSTEEKNVLVEHTAVNPNKALHVGHLRNVALGDSISRILAFTGHRVSVLNYIDDSGLQVADVIVGFKYLDFSLDPPLGVKFDHYAGDTVYVGVNKRYETDQALKEKQRHVLKAIEERDPIIFPFAVQITERILREQLSTCWRFGASYDLLVFESDIIASKLWERLFSMLKEMEIAKLETQGKLEGCWIVSIEGEKEGEDKVLVRSDGTATYVAKDTPFAALKVGAMPDRFGYSSYAVQPDGKELWRTRLSAEGEKRESPVHWGKGTSITVIDVRQARLQRVIQYILEKLSNQDLRDRYIHLGYSIISLSPRTAVRLGVMNEALGQGKEIVTMSGRRGEYINADDVFDLLKEKAIEETRKRNLDITDSKWFEKVAERIAIAAMRFSLLKQDLDKMIIFDLEDSLQLLGETGPYMLYSYARATSIISKLSQSQIEDLKADPFEGGLLSNETEVALLTLIAKFDISVEKAFKMLAPKWIAHYSFELCEGFNKFYEKVRVLQEENPDVKNARLKLVQAFRNVLKNSLDLLGIEPLEKI